MTFFGLALGKVLMDLKLFCLVLIQYFWSGFRAGLCAPPLLGTSIFFGLALGQAFMNLRQK